MGLEQNEKLEKVVGKEDREVGRAMEQRAIAGVSLLLPSICYSPARGLNMPMYCPVICSAYPVGTTRPPHSEWLSGSVEYRQTEVMYATLR